MRACPDCHARYPVALAARLAGWPCPPPSPPLPSAWARPPAARGTGQPGRLGRHAAGRERADLHAAAAQQLPVGGREIFPKYRVVAYYGAAYDGALGVLGATGPDAMADKLALQAAAYAPYGKPVLTCFELITTVANATPGSDGMYSSRGKPDMVAEYLAAARRHKSLLLLDLQPGRADFLDQLKTYEQFLKEPEVGVALDAEWRTPDSRPGKTLGHTSAAEINAVGDYLAGITKRYNLPQKLLVLHQFRVSMIPDRDKVKDWPELAETLQMDGTGIGPNGNNDKLKVYSILVPENTRFYPGFKVFYKQDYDPMSPAQVMRLKPQPVFISYQ